MDPLSSARRRWFARVVISLALAMSAACAARSSSAPGPSSPGAQGTGASMARGSEASAAARRTHENLNSVLWVQTSVEFRASAVQAYRLARLQLDAALADRRWTAAIEQTADPSALPPAVVLDLDETVLDNSGFQARQVVGAFPFTEDVWLKWCEERKATAIPGAVEFLRYARSRGVATIFITNRDRAAEQATRDVLTKIGVELDATKDVILTRSERPEWTASDKTARRQFVAAEYRILLLVGDDLGDFLTASRGTIEERNARTAKHDDYWGTRWIMLPNPAYGSWEQALTTGQTGLTDAQILAAKYKLLDSKQ